MSDDANDLEGLQLTMDDEAWETAGTNKPGRVGFKIESARIEKRTTKAGVPFPVCALEVSILQRDGVKVETSEKFWDSLSLDPRFVKPFKSLLAACGIRKEPGAPANFVEMAKALNGKAAYGTIIHREYTKDGEKQVAAGFGKKFGRTAAEVS